jgi:hypothetical protein
MNADWIIDFLIVIVVIHLLHKSVGDGSIHQSVIPPGGGIDNFISDRRAGYSI